MGQTMQSTMVMESGTFIEMGGNVAFGILKAIDNGKKIFNQVITPSNNCVFA
jgi:hypothetical protein